ncbi:MAG TPA: ATP-binding protein [Acidimicrobiales bacterium]|jgi:hypothetical protein|nr:ATP-binding protein [Acidimicrobiales bacterium]
MAYDGMLTARGPERPLPHVVGVRYASCHLSAASSCGRDAREFVQQMLAGWGWPPSGPNGDLREVQALQDVLLLTTELAINAAQHAHTPLEVSVRYAVGSHVRVEVHDEGGGCLPHPQWPASFEESGRGLALVDLLSAGWGVTSSPSGKTVWFELSLG